MTDLAALKASLSDVAGIENLTETIIGGRRVYGFNGLIAAVDMNADDAAVATAIRKAADLLRPAAPAEPVILATPIAAVAPAPAPTQPKGTSMSVTGASHAGMTLKQMMEQRKQAMADAHAKLQGSFAKLDQATEALNTVGDKVSAEADDLLATVGQFTNEIGG